MNTAQHSVFISSVHQVIPFNLENNEVTFQVFPYFFSENKDVLRYKWKLNKRLLSSETGPSLTVRKPESGSGESVLEVSAHNSSEILQRRGNSS